MPPPGGTAALTTPAAITLWRWDSPTPRRPALLVRDLESDAPRDGSGRFARGDYGAAQFATAATAGAVELANSVLAQVAL